MNATRKKHAVAMPPDRPVPRLLKGPDLALLSPTARIVGYARVSTEEQSLEVQLAALQAASCTRIYVEKISAVNAKRPQFDLMMKFVERGDTVLFHSLSRMGRKMDQILGILNTLDGDGVKWRSLTEPQLDTTTAFGRYMVNITGAHAQFERDQLSERTQRGMDNCKAKGMWLGRKPKVSSADAKKMVALRRAGLSAEEIVKRFPKLKIKVGTVYARTNKLMKKRK